MRAGAIAVGLNGKAITKAHLDHAERMHFVRGHLCAWDECDDDACFADLLRLGIATEEDRPGREAASTVYDEVRIERVRAHTKHGDTSMEAFPVDDMNRLAILMEEVGEVAKEFNEARHRRGPVALGRLRKELIQSAAMCVAWADAIHGGSLHG